jgi:regulator of sirC expression with transglutaminase-like and TPR domain
MDPAEWFTSLVRQSDDAPDLDVFAGLIGASFEPGTDVAAVPKALDELAAPLEPTFESVMSVFASGRLVGNSTDYSDPRNSYLHRVLERGLGIPITLSVCAIELGRRVGVPVRGIGLPGHFMVSCDGRFADPFRAGVIIAADQLETTWQRNTGTGAPLDRRFLAPAAPRAIVLRMLNNLMQTFVAGNDTVALATLARLRGSFAELESERGEHARWMRHWN